MKKPVCIVSLILLIHHSSNAQFTKGMIMAGTTIGSTGYNNSNSDYDYEAGNSKITDGKSYTLTAGPQAGIFVSNHLIVGFTPAVSFSKNRATTTSVSAAGVQTGSKTTSTTTTVNFGPYLRDYFATINSSNSLYVQVNGAIGTGRGSTSGDSYTASNSTSSKGKVSGILNWNAGGSAGLTHLFYQRVGMDVALGYLYTHQHQTDANTSSTINKTTGATADVSTNYKLNDATHGISFGAGIHWFIKG